MSDTEARGDPYAPPNPAITEQLREFGLTAREADQFATVLAMASNAERLGLARLLAPSLVAGAAHPPAVVAALVEALEEAVESGIVPKSSALEGGAMRFSRQVGAADKIRAALAAYRGEAGR